MKTNKFILASKSPRRFDLLKERGLIFEVITKDTPELSNARNIYKLPELNAELKATAVAEDYPDNVVIGADTIVIFDDQVIGKPKDLADAKSILQKLVGNTHFVVTGICICQISTHKTELFSVKSQVTFKPLSDEEIDNYIKNVYVLDKAGAYAMQEKHELIVEKFEGSFDNIVGLPVDELLENLKMFFN